MVSHQFSKTYTNFPHLPYIYIRHHLRVSVLVCHNLLSRLEGRDCLSTGLATHYFSSKEGWDRLDKLEDRLGEELEKGEACDIKKVLDSIFETKKSRLSISSQLEMIDKVFSLPTLGDVMEGLEALGWQAGDEGQVPRYL